MWKIQNFLKSKKKMKFLISQKFSNFGEKQLKLFYFLRVKYFQKSMHLKKVQLLNINGIFLGYFLYKKVMKSVTVRFEHKTNSFLVDRKKFRRIWKSQWSPLEFLWTVNKFQVCLKRNKAEIKTNKRDDKNTNLWIWIEVSFLLANVNFFILLVDRRIGRHFDDFLLWKQLREGTLLEQFSLATIAKGGLRI